MSHPGPTSTAATGVNAPTALRLLATAYQVSQAVYVAARLGLAELLTGEPREAGELAAATGTYGPSLLRLLRALTAFGIFDEVTPRHFTLTPIGDCLRADAPNSLRDAVVMWGSENFWQTAADLLHCVQTGETAMQHLFGVATPFAYYQSHPEMGAMMNAGWAALARGLPQEVVDAYAFPPSGTIVDVGGNRGQSLAPVLQAHPALRGVLFDLPNVIAAAAAYLDQAGVAERCTLIGGDMFAEIPSGGDLYLLSRVIHDWDDTQAAAILRNCRRAMRPQTPLLLIERVLPATLDHSANVQVSVQSDLNMLLRTGGRERTDAEFAALLTAAGFVLERIIPMPSGYSVIEAMAVGRAQERAQG